MSRAEQIRNKIAEQVRKGRRNRYLTKESYDKMSDSATILADESKNNVWFQTECDGPASVGK